jgi:hypothetical protein
MTAAHRRAARQHRRSVGKRSDASTSRCEPSLPRVSLLYMPPPLPRTTCSSQQRRHIPRLLKQENQHPTCLPLHQRPQLAEGVLPTIAKAPCRRPHVPTASRAWQTPPPPPTTPPLARTIPLHLLLCRWQDAFALAAAEIQPVQARNRRARVLRLGRGLVVGIFPHLHLFVVGVRGVRQLQQQRVDAECNLRVVH